MDILLSVLRDILTPQSGWSVEYVLRVTLSSLLLYAFVVLLARTFGSRTFASFTSYDFLINVAAGSLVASSILGQNLINGVLALASLALLQWVTSWISARSRAAHDLVDNPPVILVRQGEVEEDALRRARVSRQSLEQQLRSQGVKDVSAVQLAILESGGTVSVMTGEGEERPGTFPRRAD